MGVLSLVLGSAAAAGGAPASPGSPKYAQSTADYVASAVRDAFDRPATDADLARWAPALDVGGSRTTFALDLVREREWSERVVRDLYEFVLRRTPDPGGLAFWTEKLRSGFRSANLAAALYASNEFYEGAGAKPSAYVSLVYVS
ncbi:MAG: DUF4214 domain-containing protein, partial [Actinobacteria bacterium]|nr:DUF4214 domain-containing protein [Actinomycetota bacterium]